MSTNAQWTPSSTTQTSLTQTGLTPGTSYVLLVRAYKNNSDGTKSYSDYASIPFKASDIAPSGLNALTVNNGTDILLNGGSIFAQNTNYPFPTNLGKFNVVSGTTTGTGVVMNNTGIAAFKQGTREFYLNAATGDAYFAGTITSPAIQSTNYLPSTLTDGSAYSTAGTYINLNNGSITSKSFRIDTSGNAYFKGNIESNSLINGVPAYTVTSNAATGAASATYAYSAVQPGNFVKVDNTNQVVKIDTTGINITSSATASTTGGNTPRIEFTNGFITAYDGTSTPSFQINASTGSVTMTGQITATSGYIGNKTSGWQINSTNIASVGGTMVLDATSGSISGGVITGAILRTASYGTRIEIGTLDTYTSKYDNINFWTDATSGSTNQSAGRILVGGTTASTASLTIASPMFDSINGSPTLITLTDYNSASVLPNIIMQGNNISLYGAVSANYITSSPSSTTNGLRGITLTSTSGTPSYTGNDGDIVLVWA